ncbi:hypothetical protein YOLOSWAG_226 [Erwinia phage vB_EamM_Yoloswag]|uniref:Uncharacterized protein n=1 Tax=Erwinia phage vB_EamM_Yoloswag TaxID=1958956 RepID=A0A1S6L3E2_9CAUD|nr:hypothetical protein HOR66_gp226 [Erwinia phage vB_EamM_Yoloswag]AQT28704.1 hypothetical protein YOLOSWAG_226 [Erwinia phage vB_EamM_Yoloswag]
MIAISYSLKVMQYPSLQASLVQHNNLLVLSHIWFWGKPSDQWSYFKNPVGQTNLVWLVMQLTGVACYFGLTPVVHSFHSSGSNPRMLDTIQQVNRQISDRAQYQRDRQFERCVSQELGLPPTAFYVLRELNSNGQVQIDNR